MLRALLRGRFTGDGQVVDGVYPVCTGLRNLLRSCPAIATGMAGHTVKANHW